MCCDSHSLSCCGLEAPSAPLAPSPTRGLLPSFRMGPSYGGTFPASALATWCGEGPPPPWKGEHKVGVSGHATMSLLRCSEVPSQTVTPWRGSNSRLFPTSFSIFFCHNYFTLERELSSLCSGCFLRGQELATGSSGCHGWVDGELWRRAVNE